MRTDGSNEKGNVEDRRGMKRSTVVGGGLTVLIVGLVASYFGVNPQLVQQFLGGAGGQQQQAGPPPNDGYKEFSEDILGMMDSVWRKEFQTNRYGVSYEKPQMVLFREAVNTKGCGNNIPSGVGPFYCPADKTVYLDPTFFAELEKLGGSKAKFSQAYVIAHEVGHHVQNLLGYNDRMEFAKAGRDGFRREGENAGIRLELQADYLAGVWARQAQDRYKILDNPREVEEALKTAKSIGDDLLTKGRVSPENFNHGTAKQRYFCFKKGFDTGNASKQYLDKFFDPRIEPLKIGPNEGF
jgi:hypothetical protein